MNQQRPNLKNGVDLQLQSAFNEGNWAVVIRLAEKRARTSNDQYYEIVKICAESQLDDPNAKFGTVAAIAQFVKDGTVVKDADAIDLLEWATGDLTDEEDFVQTLGPLRVRCVKASPKDKINATRCLMSCLLHWDLESAQQIAAIIDRSVPQERSFMFWNIVITHMLSTSSQAPAAKQKLYGTLALKQIQRAAQLAEQADASKGEDAKPQPRSIQTEEEILLLYDIVEKHGTPEDFEKLVSSPIFCPITQFRQARKEPFMRVLAKHQRDSDWEAIYNICKDCLSVSDDNGQPSLLASDWAIWKQFIAAAAQLKTSDPTVEKTVQDLLLKFVKIPNLRPIYKRNILLARVSAAFYLVTNEGSDVANGQAASLRLQELQSYIADQSTSPACFNDIKSFVEELSAEGKKYLAFEHTSKLAEQLDDKVGSARVKILSLKLKYLVSTCPSTYGTAEGEKPQRKCTVCDTQVTTGLCASCFSTLASAGLEFYKSLEDLGAVADTELKPETAILIALCYIQQAFLSPGRSNLKTPASFAPLLRALLLLEHQLSLTPKHDAISLLLVQLHLLMGSAFQAREIWDTLGVKRTIMDSLAPIFYDRLSTVSPSLITPADSRGWYLMEMLETHFSVSLKLRMPRRLIDAFESGSYRSVIDIPEYIENLRWSCTRAMSVVEEVRTERLLGQQFGDLFQDPRFTEVTDDTELNEVVDYGSFPSWACSSNPPVHARLRIGPTSSNRRAHLSLLSEAFHETLTYKPPPSYKVQLATSAPEQTFVIETMNQLSNSFAKFLHGPDDDLTPQEASYFDALSLLATLIPFTVTIDRSGTLPPIFSQIVEAVTVAITTIQGGILKDGVPDADAQVSLLSSMHAVALLRDTAVAARCTCQWILAFNEREKVRDRSGKNNLPKDVIAQVKSLQAAAEAALKEGQGWIVKLKDQVFGRDFEPRVRKWVFEEDKELEAIVGDGALGALVRSWEVNIKGWKEVKWE